MGAHLLFITPIMLNPKVEKKLLVGGDSLGVQAPQTGVQEYLTTRLNTAAQMSSKYCVICILRRQTIESEDAA
jgi:hypothetical protein